jgi:hypothetical protein
MKTVTTVRTRVRGRTRTQVVVRRNLPTRAGVKVRLADGRELVVPLEDDGRLVLDDVAPALVEEVRGLVERGDGELVLM